MNFEDFRLLLRILLGLPAIGLLLWIELREAKSAFRVHRMAMQEKVRLINELAEPFGFFYVEEQDIFTARPDAWQKQFGYEAFYDRMAPAVSMVIDAVPVYFNYNGKTWLIEFWKGQYGLCTGAEVGIYHADGIVPPHLYRSTRFHAVSEEEILPVSSALLRDDAEVYEIAAKHWWLTGFSVGMFSRPAELSLYAGISFSGRGFADAFWNGLLACAPDDTAYYRLGNTVSLVIRSGVPGSVVSGLQRGIMQFFNRIAVFLFHIITFPFQNSPDRLLYLYFQLPAVFRLIFAGRKYARKYSRKGRKTDVRLS